MRCGAGSPQLSGGRGDGGRGWTAPAAAGSASPGHGDAGPQGCGITGMRDHGDAGPGASRWSPLPAAPKSWVFAAGGAPLPSTAGDNSGSCPL